MESVLFPLSGHARFETAPGPRSARAAPGLSASRTCGLRAHYRCEAALVPRDARPPGHTVGCAPSRPSSGRAPAQRAPRPAAAAAAGGPAPRAAAAFAAPRSAPPPRRCCARAQEFVAAQRARSLPTAVPRFCRVPNRPSCAALHVGGRDCSI